MNCYGKRRSAFTVHPPVLRSDAPPRGPNPPSAAALLRRPAACWRSDPSRLESWWYQAPPRDDNTLSAARPVQMVEARDAAALLRTSWFRQVGPRG